LLEMFLLSHLDLKIAVLPLRKELAKLDNTINARGLRPVPRG
jgi:hypothetical protein